jgi:ribosomal protein S18 acetylase RimI-like enzyme
MRCHSSHLQFKYLWVSIHPGPGKGITESPQLNEDHSCGVQKEVALERSVLLVAEDGGAARGVAGLVLVWCIADEAQFLEIAVHPEAQCRGIGTQLMAEALALSTRSSSPLPLHRWGNCTSTEISMQL